MLWPSPLTAVEKDALAAAGAGGRLDIEWHEDTAAKLQIAKLNAESDRDPSQHP